MLPEFLQLKLHESRAPESSPRPMPASSAQRLHILRSRFTKQEMFIPNCVAVYKRILPRSVHNLTIFFPPFRFHANTQNWNWFRSVCCCCLSLSCFFFVAVSLFSVCTYQIWIIFISLCMFIPYMKISIELKRAAKRWKHVTSYTYVECEDVSFFSANRKRLKKLHRL